MTVLDFPMAGVNRGAPEQRRAPFTTPAALNMTGRDALQGKRGGGTRGGLVKALATQIGSGNPIRMAALCRSLNATSADIFTDSFPGSAMSSDWEDGDWGASSLPTVSTGSARSSSASKQAALVKTGSATISTDAYRAVSAAISAAGTISNTTAIRLLLDTRAISAGDDEGIEGVIQYSASSGRWHVSAFVNGVQVGSTTGPIATLISNKWFKLEITTEKVINIYYDGSLVFTYSATSYTPTQAQAGIEFHEVNSSAVHSAADFRIDYSSTSVSKPSLMWVGASNGNLYYQTTLGTLVEASYDSTAPDLPSDRYLMAASYLQKLYIADHGILESGTTATTTAISTTVGELTHAGKNFTTAGVVAGEHRLELLGDSSISVGIYEISVVAQGGDNTKIRYTKISANDAASTAGAVSYRIFRPAKVFDAATATLSKVPIGDIGTTDGQFPANCSMVATYGSRLVWAGDKDYPHFAYASKSGDVENYLYGQTAAGSAYAWDPVRVTGSGAIGDVITCIFAHRDDYFVFGCRNSIVVQRGEPPGGRLNLVSDTVGIIDKKAYARLPDLSVVVMTTDGLYRIAPAADAIPMPLSRDVLPLELLAIDTEFQETAPTSGYDVLMAYSVKKRGVEIFITPRTAGSTQHWFYDPFVTGIDGRALGAFWPVALPNTMDPCSVVEHIPTGGTSTVWMGGRDGYVRIFSDSADDDDGTAITSNVTYGTIALSSSPRMEGRLGIVTAKLLAGSSDVRVYALVGNSAEECLLATPVELTEELLPAEAGDARTLEASLNGTHAAIKIEATSGRWAPEFVEITRAATGSPVRLG